MITMEAFWMGRDRAHAQELTDEIRSNAEETVARANVLLERAGFDHLSKVNSGWRPASVNAATPNAGKSSNHLVGRAVDIGDPDRSLARWCVDNLEVLSEIGLWMEHPGWTYSQNGNHWVHVQIVPPSSGKICYIPSSKPAIANDIQVG